jgi:hypothetical protein
VLFPIRRRLPHAVPFPNGVKDRVVAFEPAPAPFESALTDYRAARFNDCIRSLRGHQTLPERVLRARALLRLTRYEEASESLKTVPQSSEVSHQLRASALVVRAAVATLLGRFSRADEDLAAARLHVYSAPSPALEAEFEYYSAMLRWVQGDFAAGETGARRVLDIENSGPPPYEGSTPALAASRARAVMILGYEVAREGRFRAYVDLLLHALAELDCGEDPDPYLEAVLLRDLAFGARELDLPTVASVVRERAEVLPWTSELDEQHAHVQRSLAWCAALAGDHLGALRNLRLSAEIAPAPTWKLLALLERSYLARELDQLILAEEELRLAQDLSSTIDWEGTKGEESFGLLHLALLTAERDPAAAQSWLARYDSLHQNSSPLLLGRPDPRARALELYARGSVAEAEGLASHAVALYTDAFELWDRLGCSWRAALAASRLARTTGAASFVEYEEQAVRRRPESWLALQYARSRPTFPIVP